MSADTIAVRLGSTVTKYLLHQQRKVLFCGTKHLPEDTSATFVICDLRYGRERHTVSTDKLLESGLWTTKK
jgi:hypothetical protein